MMMFEQLFQTIQVIRNDLVSNYGVAAARYGDRALIQELIQFLIWLFNL